MNKKLFKIALRYIEKGYSYEQLRWGDDLYESTQEEREECLGYFDEIQDNGIKWAYKQLEDEKHN